MSVVVAMVLAQTFVRTMAGPQEGAACLWWATSAIEFRQSGAGNPATGATSSLAAVSNAFATWNDAMRCSSLHLAEGPRATSRRLGATPEGPNTNVVLFRSRACTKLVAATHTCWSDGSCANLFDCWDQSSALLATTTVSYDSVTGRIFDADIEFNAADHVFTVVDSPVCVDGAINQRCVATDIQNTATHEIGHFLGLGHTTARASTMNDTSTMGERTKRSLDEGTRSFLCAAYAPELGPDDCVLPPVNETLGASAPKGCSASPGWPLVFMLVPLFFRRRWAVVGLALVGTVSQAATIEALELEDLVTRADRVAWVKVASLQSRWASDHARIVTDVELTVIETWKGPASAQLEVLQPGGVVGRIGQRVSGTPTLRVGQELVVFLEARGDRSVFLGLSRGVFVIDRTTGAATVTQPRSALRTIDAETGREHEVTFAPIALSQFRAQIVGQVEAVAPTPVLQGADSNRALPVALPTQISR